MLSPVSTINIINHVFDLYIIWDLVLTFFLESSASGEGCCVCNSARVSKNRGSPSLIPVPHYVLLAASIVIPVALVTVISLPIFYILQIAILSAAYGTPKKPYLRFLL